MYDSCTAIVCIPGIPGIFQILLPVAFVPQIVSMYCTSSYTIYTCMLYRNEYN